MDYDKIASMLFKMEMDDLKDADCYADYAKKVMDYGDSSLAQMIANRAKARLSQLTEMQRTIDTVMSRMKDEKVAAGETMMEGGIWEDMYKSYVDEWTSSVKKKLENM